MSDDRKPHELTPEERDRKRRARAELDDASGCSWLIVFVVTAALVRWMFLP